MFNRKKRALEAAEADKRRLHEENARLRDSPFIGIAESIVRQTDRELDTATDIGAVIDAAVDAERAAYRARRIKALSRAATAAALAEEKERLTEQASQIAEAAAQESLRAFKAGGAAVFLDDEVERLTKKLGPKLINEEKERLREQARERVEANAAARALEEFSSEDPRADREYSKARAAGIRKETKLTRMLHLDKLLEGDVLEIGFVKAGKGNEPHTESTDGYYGYSSRERSELIQRTVVLRLMDPTEGTAVVMDDSWFEEEKPSAMRPLTQVNVFCVDSLSDEQAQISGIEKAQPLAITNMSGDLLTDQSQEVWFVELNEFRVLS